MLQPGPADPSVRLRRASPQPNHRHRGLERVAHTRVVQADGASKADQGANDRIDQPRLHEDARADLAGAAGFCEHDRLNGVKKIAAKA